MSIKKMGSIGKSLSALAGRTQPEDKVYVPSGSYVAPVRREKKAVMIWVDPEVTSMLKDMAHDHRVTQQSLLRDALNLLFRSYGKAEIA
jgi:hypothetical protein